MNKKTSDDTCKYNNTSGSVFSPCFWFVGYRKIQNNVFVKFFIYKFLENGSLIFFIFRL